jgi:cytochrome c553
MLPQGQHNAGQDCIGCHNANGGVPANTYFTIAGTVVDANGGGIAGATVVVTDNNQAQKRLVTATNGNFYTTDTIAFPVTVKVTSCPTTKKMTAQVQSSGGSCNSCHANGGSQPPLTLP